MQANSMGANGTWAALANTEVSKLRRIKLYQKEHLKVICALSVSHVSFKVIVVVVFIFVCCHEERTLEAHVRIHFQGN